MGEDENRSKLFDEIRKFSQRKLRKVETKVTTGSGEQVTEKRSAKGLTQIKSDGINGPGYVLDHKPDLQVGMIIPGLYIASQDVAQDKSILENFAVTHILNLAYGVENAFEDDFNYKKLEILDVPETDITQYFEECFDFIQEGIQRGNCLVHCNAGVSRSTAICCAYLMKQQKIKYKESLALIREARAFAKPNDGFAKQLEDYQDALFGQFQAPDSIEDAFTARKRAEIEAEKAALSGTSSVKKKLKEVGAQLEKIYEGKLRTITPIKLPLKRKPSVNKAPLTNHKGSELCGNAPPPPPPPPPCLNSNAPAPPPPPPPCLQNEPGKTRKPLHKGKPEPKKLVITPTKTKDPNGSPTVDETPITVANQRKLWENSNSNDVNHQKPEIRKIPATPNNVSKNKLSWNPMGQQQTPAPPPVPPAVASPETKKKKIILKKGNEVSGERRRSTRDLVEAIEAVSACNSQSSSPYSSPGPQRRQVPYGRRQTTQIAESNAPQPKPTQTRKPMWSLRDQVDSLSDVPSPSTPRSRSPATKSPSVASTPRQSHSPSPQRFGQTPTGKTEETSRPKANSNKVFGRVPPRKTSLSGAGTIAPNETSENNLPVVASPAQKSTSATSKSANKQSSMNNDKPSVSKRLVSPPKEPSPSKTTKRREPDTGNNTKESDIRSGFKRVPLGETKERSVNRSVEARRNRSGLNRSSTAEILKLIKTKSRAEFGTSMETVDEDVEIDFLLQELDKEGVENIDWCEIGLDENEVKDIVEKNRDEIENDSGSKESSKESSESSTESSSDEDSDDEMQHTVFNTTRSSPVPKPSVPEPKKTVTSNATITLKPANQSSSAAPKAAPVSQPVTNSKPNNSITYSSRLVVEEDSSSEEEDSEEETDSD